MSAPSVMPYFIKPSTSLTTDEKEEAYRRVYEDARILLDGEPDLILKMSTLNSLLKTHLPYFYWVGFYIVRDDRLHIGPYQGTLGCLHIDLGRGVCGRAALSRQTIIVSDCHALTEGSEHIACDPHSKSEIVVPVLSDTGDLIAVLDVDSTLESSFEPVDQQWLERIVKLL